jgi:hypothetical protein
MSNKRLEEIEINIARHIKNPHYREKFVKDGYAKILLQRVEDWVDSRFFTEDSADFIEYFNQYTHVFIAYISAEYTVAIVRFNINTGGTYYPTFNSDGVKIKDEFMDLVHDYRIIFERCYDDAKSRQLNKTEEEITYSIKDEDKKGSFIFDTEAKTLFNLITEYRRRCMKEETDEAVNQYTEFIRIIYGIKPNIDRRMLKPLKIKRIDDHIDHIARTDLPVHSEPYCYNITNAQLNELFDWVAQQVQNETNQEARQAYSRVLDAIAVISDEDRFNRLSIDEKIAVMHFLEDNKS